MSREVWDNIEFTPRFREQERKWAEECDDDEAMPSELEQPMSSILDKRKQRYQQIYNSLPRHTDVLGYVNRMKRAWELLREEE